MSRLIMNKLRNDSLIGKHQWKNFEYQNLLYHTKEFTMVTTGTKAVTKRSSPASSAA